MKEVKPLSTLQTDKLFELFRDYVTIGGMPEVVKRFQITKIGKNARNRDYVGCVEWLADAGVINLCYCLNQPELPLPILPCIPPQEVHRREKVAY
jgi:hypothetical protein